MILRKKSWFISWLIDWLIDCLDIWLINQSNDWLVVLLIDLLIAYLIGFFIDWSIDCLLEADKQNESMCGRIDGLTHLSTELWRCETAVVISDDSHADGIGVGGRSDAGGDIFLDV